MEKGNPEWENIMKAVFRKYKNASDNLPLFSLKCALLELFGISLSGVMPGSKDIFPQSSGLTSLFFLLG